MKTAYDLLMSAPDDQVTRCKIVMRAIIAGNWEDAAFTLNAAANEATGEWAANAKALADHCRSYSSRPHSLLSPEHARDFIQKQAPANGAIARAAAEIANAAPTPHGIERWFIAPKESA